jgi:hypothetical protein
MSALGYQFMDTQQATLFTVAGLAYVNEHCINSSSTKTLQVSSRGLGLSSLE